MVGLYHLLWLEHEVFNLSGNPLVQSAVSSPDLGVWSYLGLPDLCLCGAGLTGHVITPLCHPHLLQLEPSIGCFY